MLNYVCKHYDGLGQNETLLGEYCKGGISIYRHFRDSSLAFVSVFEPKQCVSACLPACM